jgi:hypothetical protein
MRVTGLTANLSVPDIGEARDFYVDYSASVLRDSTWAGSTTSSSRMAGRSSSSLPVTRPLHMTR